MEGSFKRFGVGLRNMMACIIRRNLDLTPLAGQSVNFILTVYANGDPTSDRALWVGPQIIRNGTSGVTSTPTSVPTNTPMSAPSATNSTSNQHSHSIYSHVCSECDEQTSNQHFYSIYPHVCSERDECTSNQHSHSTYTDVHSECDEYASTQYAAVYQSNVWLRIQLSNSGADQQPDGYRRAHYLAVYIWNEFGREISGC